MRLIDDKDMKLRDDGHSSVKVTKNDKYNTISARPLEISLKNLDQ